jgi:hypothetical protein
LSLLINTDAAIAQKDTSWRKSALYMHCFLNSFFAMVCEEKAEFFKRLLYRYVKAFKIWLRPCTCGNIWLLTADIPEI